GKVFVTTELGGGGTASAYTAEIAIRGTRNFLIAAGVMEGEAVEQPTQWLDMLDDDGFTFAEDGGLIQFLADLGDRVEKDEPVARGFPVARTGLATIILPARRGGLSTARHFPGLVKPGDCVAVISETVDC